MSIIITRLKEIGDSLDKEEEKPVVVVTSYGDTKERDMSLADALHTLMKYAKLLEDSSKKEEDAVSDKTGD